MTKNMQAIVLAGGKGTRLKPYTNVLPKPLMPIGDYSILEVTVCQLKFYGFTNITMTVNHLKELIQSFFSNGERWGVDINYSMEDKPLGTAAPIKLIDNLDTDFLVMNGDILTNINFKDFFDFHVQNKNLLTIATYKKKVKVDLGVLIVENGLVEDYIEKPIKTYDVSMGMYIFNSKVLDYINYNEYMDIPDLVKTLLKQKQKVSVFEHTGIWLDIGRPEDYETACQVFEENITEFLR